MAIEVSADKTMFGRRTGLHTATLGEFSAQGKTATEAKSALLTLIAEHKPFFYVIGTKAGDVFVVTRSIGGTEYRICGGQRTYASGCLMAHNEREKAIQQARAHAEQSFGGIAWEHAG